MDEQQAQALALEAHVRRGRGECRLYRSDDLTQPDGGGPCRMEPNAESGVIAPCALCGQPCPDPHIHLFERDPNASDRAGLEAAGAAIGFTPDLARRYAELLTELRERAENAPLGLCSEGCAIRYQAGEPTTDERRELDEYPYTHAFFGLLDQATHAAGSPAGPAQPEPPRSKDRA